MRCQEPGCDCGQVEEPDLLEVAKALRLKLQYSIRYGDAGAGIGEYAYLDDWCVILIADALRDYAETVSSLRSTEAADDVQPGEPTP